MSGILIARRGDIAASSFKFADSFDQPDGPLGAPWKSVTDVAIVSGQARMSSGSAQANGPGMVGSIGSKVSVTIDDANLPSTNGFVNLYACSATGVGSLLMQMQFFTSVLGLAFVIYYDVATGPHTLATITTGSVALPVAVTLGWDGASSSCRYDIKNVADGTADLLGFVPGGTEAGFYASGDWSGSPPFVDLSNYRTGPYVPAGTFP